MKALTLALAASISLTSLPIDAHNARHHNRKQVVIMNDRGGEIGQYERQYQALHRKGSQVRIAGNCMSACTMYLGLPGTCVYPNARIGFHRARDYWGNPSQIGTWDMVRHYPGWLQGIVEVMPEGMALAVYSGMDLIRMGARPCL